MSFHNPSLFHRAETDSADWLWDGAIMQLGYARVSTGDQTLDLQRDALSAAACDRIYEETASGANPNRPVLLDAIAYTRAGDVLVVWRLDRLGRSLPHLLTTVRELEQRGIGFTSLTEQIAATSPGGKLDFHLFGALAEFECDLIRERTHAGLAAVRARGRFGGRPKVLTDPKVVAIAKQLHAGKQTDIATICATLGISRSTLYRELKSDAAVS